jgi:phytanoyl-CoA hydroxylase
MVGPVGHRVRVHFLHRELEIHERFLLHPRIVDNVAGLVGPDVLALQTMLLVKPPGSSGQGYHQDSFHIVTQPDTLLGAWVALDGADEENGCVWIRQGSQHEPVYPDADATKGHGGDMHANGRRAASNTDKTVTGHPPNGQQRCAPPYQADEDRATALLREPSVPHALS